MTVHDVHSNPRLAEVYDLEYERGPDTDFWLSLAVELNARTIIDLGCGTGLLTRELAVDGRVVIGVDSAPAMLALAQRRDCAVQWIEGDAAAIRTADADLVVMTGNVAQVITADAEWDATLRHVHAGLRPDGWLAFDSRNPAARAWETWTPVATRRHLETPEGSIETWLEVTGVEDGLVHVVGHNVFASTGEDVLGASLLRCRTLDEITSSLVRAGFDVHDIYGDWARRAATPESPFFVVVARRP